MESIYRISGIETMLFSEFKMDQNHEAAQYGVHFDSTPYRHEIFTETRWHYGHSWEVITGVSITN